MIHELDPRRRSALWLAVGVCLLLHRQPAYSQTAAAPIKLSGVTATPSTFSPSAVVKLPFTASVRLPDGFLPNSHTLSLQASWVIASPSGPLNTISAAVPVTAPFQYSPTAGPTSTHPVVISTTTLEWNVALTNGGCVPDGKLSTVLTVSGVVDRGSGNISALPATTKPLTITCKGALPTISGLAPAVGSFSAIVIRSDIGFSHGRSPFNGFRERSPSSLI